MARIEKGSRIKFLPPKVQLLHRDLLQTTSPVGMVGSASLAFDDTKTEQIGASSSLNLPSGLPFGSRYFNTSISTSINVPGVVVENVIEPFLVPSEPITSYRPFVEHCLPESDAKRSNASSFYATGSKIEDVGEGFSQPLWSKTKIVFDLTPSVDHSFGIENFLSGVNNFPMAYWNKDTRTYVGVGAGGEFDKPSYQDTSVAGLQNFLSQVAIGFGSSLDNGGIPTGIASASFLIGNPIDNYGFPTAQKFVASPSNLIPMKDYISEPFLVEKMVLYFSGAINLHSYRSPQSWAGLTTFFVLNQRGGYVNKFDRTITYYSASTVQRLTTISETELTTQRDLVTWMQMSRESYSDSTVYNTGLKREFNYLGSSVNFSGQVIMSGSMKNPFSYKEGVRNILINNQTINPDLTTCEYIESFAVSGRNLTTEGGRSFINPNQTPEVFGNVTFEGFVGGSLTTTANSKYSKINPYLLLPTDNLVFGWEVPYARLALNRTNGSAMYQGIGPHLTASASGIHKVIFYGSLLRNNKEYHTSFETAMETDIFSTQLGG